MATVYAVASAKGGVGKTTTTAAIATILAEAGADVVAIDADVGMANLADALGMVPGETTVHDVLAGRADPSEAVHDGPAGLRVVPGDPDLDAYAAADPTELGGVIEAFADADYVFLDAGAGLSHDSTLPIGLADETLLVSTPDRSALGDTEKTRQLAERIGGRVAGAAITRVGGDEDESAGLDDADETGDPESPTVDIVDEILATDVLARIPEDPTVARASTAGEPLSVFDPDAPATRAYRELTRALTGTAIAEPEAEAESDEDAEAESDEEAEVGSAEDPETEGAEDADRDDDADDADDTGDADDGDDAGDTDDEAQDAEPGAIVEDAEEGEEEAAVDAAADASTEDGGDARDTGGTPGSELIDEAEPDPDDAADVDADEEDASDADDDDADDEEDGEGDVGDEREGDDADEEGLEGSVPFRDDDGAMDTALTGGTDEDRESGAGGDETEGEDEDGDDEDGDDEKRGFFGRLLGR
ncbi:nucleotide-binding protein [Halorubrum aethiopicum]|uniref:nucleotide-binding protein n=1 Tax=Halorubrum aethiopicum TaxID=1758255 RepID=UPI00082DC7BE|nr:P-loop NTPase [Halorubrum aethiopicum]